MAPTPDSILVFAAMRNEGAFLLEWVTWYRMLGFEVLVGINDCTDHSPQLLDALARAGWLTTFEHHPNPGQPPKTSAHRAMQKRPEVRAADWLLICDVDEFLVLRRGDTIADYLAQVDRSARGIAFHWRCFGTGGIDRYEDGLVHRQFTRCGPADMTPNIFFKTLVRRPREVARFTDHGPAALRDGQLGQGPEVIRDAAGRVIDRFTSEPGPVRFTAPADITHATAQMNHYILRSREGFGLKRGTPSASASKDRYTNHFFRARDVNTETDTSALACRDRFDALHARAMALPDVARLHHLCCADYVARLSAAAGKPPESDPRWRHHMEKAGATA
jgi:hypothetical protein